MATLEVSQVTTPPLEAVSTTTYYVAETASNGGVVTCETSRVATPQVAGVVAMTGLATLPIVT